MSDQKPYDKEQTPPSQDELQERAQSVWKSLKCLFSGIFLIAVVVVALVGLWLFHAFGFTGLIVGTVVLVVGLFLLCKHLLTY
jgi:membrane protein YdbS with pleckstrin-like domain